MTVSITISKKMLAVLLALIGLIGAVTLVSANHDQDIIHACLKKDGTINVVSDSIDCKKHDEAITLATEGVIVSLESQISSQQDQLDDLESRLSVLENLLVNFSRSGDDIIISGANLHIVNGLNDTETTNSLGNVIVGYNEFRGSGDDRTGSHMLIVGSQHNFNSYGGAVFGLRNESGAPFATVSAGTDNRALGNHSSISGGTQNTASGPFSSVTGGFDNMATNEQATVSGGNKNIASGVRSIVTGGHENEASGSEASVTGGNENVAIGNGSTVSGGFRRTAPGQDSWAAGGLYEGN